MNQLMITLAILFTIGLGFLVKNIVDRVGKNEKVKTSEIPKNGYGRFWKWVIVISVFAALGLIAPKYLKKGWKEAVKTDASTPIYAISEWKKKPEQYGTSPEKRRSGPMDTTITRRTGGVFNFKISYTDKNGNPRLAKFEGEYVEKKNPEKVESPNEKKNNISKVTKIIGTWRQDYPQDYGDWYLVSVDGDRLFEGCFSGKTGEQIPFFLKIKKE